MEGDDPKEDRRLWLTAGGFIGNARAVGVPGVEGTGEPRANDEVSPDSEARGPMSGGAGLLEDILRAGRSILVNLPCCDKVNWPSFVFRAYM